MMFIGTIALTGVGIPGTVIGTAGFFSKDAIIESTFASHSIVSGFAFAMLVIAALFTSFYSWRLTFMTFHGKPRASSDVMHHVHESPQVMLVPLYHPGGRRSARRLPVPRPLLRRGLRRVLEGCVVHARPENEILA